MIAEGSDGIWRPSAEFAQFTTSLPSYKQRDARCTQAFHPATHTATTCVLRDTGVPLMRSSVVSNSVGRLQARSKDMHIGEILTRAYLYTYLHFQISEDIPCAQGKHPNPLANRTVVCVGRCLSGLYFRVHSFRFVLYS